LNSRRIQVSRGTICLALLGVLILLAATGSPGQAEDRTYALLVVGNATDKAMVAREKDTYRALMILRDRLGVDRTDLPIISYHVSKPNEKVYCEKALGIQMSHLLFAGLVECQARVARKVVFRVNDVGNGYEAAVKVMTQAARVLKKDPALLRGSPSSPVPGASASPAPRPSAAPSAQASGSPSPGPVPGVSLLRVDVVNGDGKVQRRFEVADGGAYINVYLHNEDPGRHQHHTLQVRILGPDGKLFGRALGGSFTVEPGQKLDEIELLKRADGEHHNGYLISGKTMGRNPGRYVVIVEVDRVEAGRTDFQVGSVSGVTQPSPDIEVARLYLADAQGIPRYRFSRTDPGVYIHVLFNNRAPSQRQDHTVQAICYDADGRSYHRPLGGRFVVEPGDKLEKKDFPREADEERADGFLISGHRLATCTGSYRVVIEVDQRPMRVMHFRITD
jgi:hypothetical protein